MSLIKCPECGREVSTKATSCPSCGYPISENLTKRSKPRKQKKSKHPRLPNGFGSITELNDPNLRNPFRAMVTVGKTNKNQPIRKLLKPQAYFPTWNAAYRALDEYNKDPYSLNDDLTIEELYKAWSDEYFEELETASSVRTVKSAWLYVQPFMRRLPINSVQPYQIKDYINKDACKIDENGKKIWATENIQSRIKSLFNIMFDYAVDHGKLNVNPARQTVLKGIQGKIEKKRKAKVPITLDDEKRLWEDIDFGYSRMVLINIYSSWRPQELVKLKKENIDLDKGYMIGGMKTDAGKERLHPIHPKIKELIRYYYDKSAGDYLFYDYDKTKPSVMTYDKYRGRFQKIMEHHGLSKYSASCPRHTFSTRAKLAEMDEYARKLIMGHIIYDTTDKHYTHIGNGQDGELLEFLQKEIEKIK
ncbi:tyrosine-type recombinase/integrase [Anaerostipes caccae]|uniref:tyrosine-type recombinase/integrase n=1 Tax=Anaerostipes caccae TaxID=105841 RepID=UPI0038D442DF